METTGSKGNERKLGSRLLEKALMPIVATAASAAASYAAKKAPQLLEDKLVPKLRGLARDAGGAARDLPGKAKATAGDAGDVAEHLTERVKSVAGGASRTAQAKSGRGRNNVSSAELERRARERAAHRSARRKATR
jgi:hypothetical protein